MSTATTIPSHGKGAATNEPRLIFHASFEDPGAEGIYGGVPANNEDAALGFMLDDVTRDCSERMHYAAWRASGAKTTREATRWRGCFYDCRNRIVIGNRKLTYRAVHKWHSVSQLADDMAGECQIVLIKAVAAFNPWLGIRFSTYAFTCLMRALSRLSQRHAADRLSRSMPLESMPYGEPSYAIDEEPPKPAIARLDEYLEEEHTLLTPREKTVLTRRFHLNNEAPRTETLEQVGRDLGLSKERVRQVQMSALGKLRGALLSGMSVS
jgi:RNA polymerase sigma factor (sigma-70 family)